MTWNHRIIRDNCGHLAIHEVYYTGNVPTSCTAGPIVCVGETLDEVRAILEQMKAACELPILDMWNFSA